MLTKWEIIEEVQILLGKLSHREKMYFYDYKLWLLFNIITTLNHAGKSEKNVVEFVVLVEHTNPITIKEEHN